jgi:hypothetical protein
MEPLGFAYKTQMFLTFFHHGSIHGELYNQVLMKWLDDPKMGPLVAEMWKQMMAQQQQQ